MAKILIMYFSKYGSTKAYAEWIASELNGDIYDLKNVNRHILQEYDTIVLGSGLYAGKVKGINLIVNNYESLKDKKLVLFTCGSDDYSKMEKINTVTTKLEKMIPANIMENIKLFCLRGILDYRKLYMNDKILMWFFKNMVIRKLPEGEEKKVFMDTYGKKTGFIDKNSIKDIIEYCKQGKTWKF